MKKILQKSICLYRKIISPFLGKNCRFYPSCSEYAEEAVMRKGAIRGMIAATVRILKCNPFHPGGFDPVE